MSKTQNEIQALADKYINNHTFVNQTGLVSDLLENGTFQYDDIRNMYIENEEGEEEAQEIYQWILVDDRTASLLEKHNEPVLNNDYGTWWGRTSFGQIYSMDAVMYDIIADIHG